MSGSPRIVAPTAVRLDERFSVRLVGFPPYRRVTVRARMPLDGRLWESRAVVETDGEGRVDLDEQTPVDGTYEQADAMGLVWSAMRIGDRPAPTAHTKTDGNVSIVTALDGNTVATATVERRFADAGVTVESVDDPDLVADLYEPPGDEPHPGVLLLGGSSGGFPSRRAASLLASRGFAVLALAYFGVEDLPRDLVGVPLEYVDRAVEWLATDDRVRSHPLGVVGWSRGGELALLTGARCERVRTVVAYVPSTVVFQGNELTGDPGSAWTENGGDVPYVPLDQPPGFRARTALRWFRGEAVSVRPLFERGLERTPTERVTEATIPVEETGGPVLLITGDDDRVWPAGPLTTRAMARLDARGYPHSYVHRHLPAAGHDIKVPYHPTTERATRSMRLPGRSLELDMGGSPAGYARADARAWEATLDTLGAGLVPE
jgi:dienelactone hydrolase